MTIFKRRWSLDMDVNNLRSRIVCLQAVSLHFIEDDLLIKEAVNTSSTYFFYNQDIT